MEKNALKVSDFAFLWSKLKKRSLWSARLAKHRDMGLSLVQFNVTIDIGMDNEKISKIFGQPGFYEITTHMSFYSW